MKQIFILIVLAAAVYFGIQFIGEKGTESKLWSEAKGWCQDEHVAWVGVNATVIKTISNLPGGGSIYFRTDGSSIVCPVVGPDSISAECEAANAIRDWKVVCPTE